MDEIESLLLEAASADAARRDAAVQKLLAMGPSIAPVLLRKIYHGIGTEAEVWSAETTVLERLLTDHPGLLVESLKDRDFEVRAGAAYAMWWADEARSIEALADAMLNDPHPEVQYCAMGSLSRNSEGLKRSSAGIESFVRFLSHDEVRFRTLAVHILGQMGDEKAVPFLISSLADGDESVRANTVKTLAQLKTPAAIPHLLHTLREDRALPVRAAAIAEIGQLKLSDAVPDLIVYLKDTSMPRNGLHSHRRLCDLAWRALDKIGTPEALDAAARWRRGELH